MADQKSVKSLFYLLDAAAENPEKLRKMLIEKIKSGPSYWLIRDLDQYRFISPEAKQLQKTIGDIQFNETMDTAKLLEQERVLNECILKFRKLFRSNPFSMKFRADKAEQISTGRYGGCLVSRDGTAEYMPLDEFCKYKRINAETRAQTAVGAIDSWKQEFSGSLQDIRKKAQGLGTETIQNLQKVYKNARISLFKAFAALFGSGLIALCLFVSYPRLIYGSLLIRAEYVVLAYIALRFLTAGISEVRYAVVKNSVNSTGKKFNSLQKLVSQDIPQEINSFADSLKQYSKNIAAGQSSKLDDGRKINLRSVSAQVDSFTMEGNKIKSPVKRYLYNGRKIVWLVIACAAALYMASGVIPLRQFFDGAMVKGTENTQLTEPVANGQTGAENPAAENSIAEESIYYRMEADSGNIRKEPNLRSDVIGTYPKGTRLEFLKASQDDGEGRTWLNIRTPDGQDGWVSSGIVAEE